MVKCPGLMRVDLRTLKQFYIPGGEHLYNHRKHQALPAAYVSGRLWGQAETERQWTYQRLTGAGGWIAVEIYFPLEAYQGNDPFYEGMNNGVLMGKSLAFLLACNACVRISEAGIFSLAEQAMAKFLGIPVATAEEFNPNIVPKTMGREEIDKLKGDKLTVLEHIDELGLRELLTRSMMPEEEKDLGQHTFWDYIQQFFNATQTLVSMGDNFVKYRLRDLFGRGSFPIFRTLVPSQKDARRCMATIDGQVKFVNVFDFENNFGWFWYLGPDDRPILCQLIKGTEEFETVAEAVWEDEG